MTAVKRLVGGAGGLFLSACVGSPGQIVNRTMRPEVASATVGMLIEGGIRSWRWRLGASGLTPSRAGVGFSFGGTKDGRRAASR